MSFDKNIYLALLRGINVGGNNIIKMVDLKKSFEDIGFTGVKTYIQSGNVVFETEFEREFGCEDELENDLELEFDRENDDEILQNLTSTIENQLSSRFNYQSKVVVVSKNQF